MVFVMAVLPLYTGGSYYRIGDNKYYMFRNVSLFCLGLWLAIEVVCGVAWLLGNLRGKKRAKMWIKAPRSLSPVDYFVLAYAAANILSAIFSRYKNTAVFGYDEWYMGALSQLIFVGIYFFVSRTYDGKAYPVYAAEAALFFVVALGFTNRLGIDPFGMYTGYHENDWEYSHMLSTVGNINWLCGYIADAVPFCIVGFLYCFAGPDQKDKKKKGALLFIVSALTIAFLIMHGSDAGLVIAAVCMLFCLTVGRMLEYRRYDALFFQKGLLLAGTAMLIVAAVGNAIIFRKNVKATPNDSFIQGWLNSPIWWILAVLFFASFLIYRRCRPKAGRRFRVVFLATLITFSLISASLYALRAFSEAGSVWATGRGMVWLSALEGFRHAPLVQKLIGAGPDCFAEYIYGLTDIRLPQIGEGFWKGAIYANAHNEWLNQLINIGVVGVAAYAGIFVSAAKRYRGMPAGLLVIVLYILNSLVSFQQVMNAPMLFLLLGMFERKTDLTAK